MRTRRPATTFVLVAALLLTACGAEPSPTVDDLGSAAVPPGAEPTEQEEIAPEPGSVTEQTLQSLRDLDPEVAAGAHDHGGAGDHPDHGDHGDHGDHEQLNEFAQAARLSGVDPERIVIPAIGVDADVIDLGIEPNGDMEVPSDYAQTGWFRNSPKPGRVGPALIAGHVDDRSGPAVFFRLSQLEPGDEIEVHGEDGTVVVFAVTGQEQFPKDELPQDLVFGGTGTAELRLVTCGGDFDRDARSYTDNTIVFAERIDHLDA